MTDVYGDPDGYKAYQISRGNSAADDLDNTDDIAPALLVASEWIDGNYFNLFPGVKTAFRLQDRQWPRTGAYDIDRQTIQSDEIPIEVINATYEAARRQIASPGALRTDVKLGTSIIAASVSGAVSVTYAGVNSASDLQLLIPIIDAILLPILVGNGAVAISPLSGRTVRA